MARKVKNTFFELQQQARKVLAGLASEIRSKKTELSKLELEFKKIVGLAGHRATRPAARRGGKKSGRINWSEVLAKLPKEFKASNIRSIPGLKDKRPSELFAAITRWIDSGVVKKKTRGSYLRTK